MTRAGRMDIDGTGYAHGPVTKAPNWHGLVAWDMLFNSLSAGLFLVAAVGELAAPAGFGRVALAAYPLALAFLLIDLALLVLDLGDPLRFHHMLRIVKPTSPMSVGIWSITAFSLPLTLAAALSVLPVEGPVPEVIRKIAVVLGLIPALGSAIYKGVLLSTSAQPGWKDARWLGAYLANSAFLLGCAVLLVLAILMGEDTARDILRSAILVILVINAVPLGLLLAEFRPTLAMIYTPQQMTLLMAVLVIAGTLFPLILLIPPSGLLALVTAVLLLTARSVAIRFLIVWLPHQAGASS